MIGRGATGRAAALLGLVGVLLLALGGEGAATRPLGVSAGATTRVVTSGADSGPGSLRDIVENVAKPGDTIVFDVGSVLLNRDLVIPQRLFGLRIRGPVVLGTTTALGSTVTVEADRVTIEGVQVELHTLRIESAKDVRVRRSRFMGSTVLLSRGEGSRIESNELRTLRGRELIRAIESERLTVTDNTLNGASIELLRVAGAEVARNRIRDFTFGAISVSGPTADVLLLGNRIEAGRRIVAGTADGIEVLPSRRGPSANVLARDNTITGNSGDGFSFEEGARGAVEGGLVSDNGGAGVFVAGGAFVRISDVLFGGNKGPGIDLAPRGVTPNPQTKTGNGDLDWPERLGYDIALGRVVGRTCPRCLVEAFRIEDGAREGNPRNGEGDAFRGSVQADGEGRFAFPRTGRLRTCAQAKRLTFTATRMDVLDHTSEFSTDLACRVPTPTPTTPPPTPPTGGPGGSKETPPAEVPAPRCPPACELTAFWEVFVPLQARSASCTFVDVGSGQPTTPASPLFPGVAQQQTCELTGREKVVGGVRKRVVRAALTLSAPEGTPSGRTAQVKVVVRYTT